MTSTHTSLPVAGGQAVRHLLLGTAGHIDHGKTALIKALTGVDTDRLPEEQRRGMTIELGFAHLTVGRPPQTVNFGIVDVPGHERFVRTMVAGATAIDLALLVVAADDSVMPQTREHVAILDLLGVTRGVVAVSKCDLVDREMAELVREEIRELLADTPLAASPIVPVSALRGEGLDELKAALLTEGLEVPPKEESSVFRLAVDRVFTIHGRGTVVTGSAISGAVSVGETLEVLPSQQRCKVRGLESHFDQAQSLHLGQRVAVNLAGIERAEIRRGDELATPDYLTPSRVVDAALRCLSSAGKPVKHLQRVRLCMGTRESLARVRLLRDPILKPGQAGPVQFVSREPLVAAWGQRFIIRDETDSQTLGGGTILRPFSCRLRRTDQADIDGLDVLLAGAEVERLEETIRFENSRGSGMCGDMGGALLLACRSGVAAQRVQAVLAELRHSGRILLLGDQQRPVAARFIEWCRSEAVAKLRRFHEQNREEPGFPLDAYTGWLKRRWGEELSAHVLGVLCRGDKVAIRVVGRYCCLPEFAPQMSAEDERLLGAIVAEYHGAAFQPLPPAGLKCTATASKSRVDKLIKIGTATGDLVRIAPDIVLHAGRIEELKIRIAQAAQSGPGVTVADVRTMIDSSRKFVVPLLEYLDKTGYTKRVGDHRILATTRKEPGS